MVSWGDNDSLEDRNKDAKAADGAQRLQYWYRYGDSNPGFLAENQMS